MQLKRLKLVNYRNYADLEAEFQPGINVLTGPNGAGKSNLLEAVHYLSYIRSFRTTRDAEIISHGKPYAVVEAALLDDFDRPFDVRLILRGGQKHIRLNGTNMSRYQDYIGKLHSHFFFPGNLALVTGDPSIRREILDLELLRLKPKLLPVLSAYRSALRERNSVLKTMYSPGGNQRQGLEKALAAFTEQLVESGARIVAERREMSLVLDGLFVPLYRGLAPPKGESVSLEYRTTIGLPNEKDLVSAFSARLGEASQNEMQLRFTTVGPHRDDLIFLLDGERDLKRYGSQGQTRSAALSFSLALCSLSTARNSDEPILLLDDALSEMDDGRKSRLLGICRKRKQVFITSASENEVELVAPHASAVYDLKASQLHRRN